MAATNTTDPVDPPGESSEDPAPLPEAEARRRHQQEIVRRVLAAGGDYGDAADEADISRRTVARWMSDPTFAKSVSDARAEQVQAVTGQLTSLADGAVLVLSELLVEGTNPERLRAAQMVLDWGTRLRRDTEIEARVLELETRLGLADPRGDEEGDPRRAVISLALTERSVRHATVRRRRLARRCRRTSLSSHSCT